MVKLFSKNSNLCDHNPLTLQTDRQTTCDRNTALCTKVHCAVKKELAFTSGRPDFLQRRRNFDARGTFYALSEFSSDRFNRNILECDQSNYSSRIILSYIPQSCCQFHESGSDNPFPAEIIFVPHF